MPLASGTHLGSCEILAPLGAGGMGEVYRARDTKLDRDVAIKVLRESCAADRDRVARFEREAKTLASLNHPNIGQISGLEDGPGEAGHYVRALVLETGGGPDAGRSDRSRRVRRNVPRGTRPTYGRRAGAADQGRRWARRT